MPAPDPAMTLDAVTATLTVSVHNKSLQRLSDGADFYAENLRYAYLQGKDMVSFAEAQGVRHVVESGAGRTRAETNNPANTAAAGGA